MEDLGHFCAEVPAELGRVCALGQAVHPAGNRDDHGRPGMSFRLRAAATWSASRSVSARATVRPCLVMW
jgi:hypothetical protein